MKKIGFIDYYIDEWHAQNLPQWIRESSAKDRFEIALAWEQTTPAGKMSLDEYCRKQGIGKASSLEELIRVCDCLIVLSPDNSEKHEELAELALQSGKPLYIDKPVAPDLAAARRLFDKAKTHGTPMFSSSALRFTPALRQALGGPLQDRRVQSVITTGPGVFEIYGIHQLEMIVEVMGGGARRVQQVGSQAFADLLIDYGDTRQATLHMIGGYNFSLHASFMDKGEKQGLALPTVDGFFPPFTEALLRFFETRQPPLAAAQTLEVAALIEAGGQAIRQGGQWIDVPRA